MFAHCKGPFWGRDDFSRCFEQEYVLLFSHAQPCDTPVSDAAAALTAMRHHKQAEN